MLHRLAAAAAVFPSFVPLSLHSSFRCRSLSLSLSLTLSHSFPWLRHTAPHELTRVPRGTNGSGRPAAAAAAGAATSRHAGRLQTRFEQSPHLQTSFTCTPVPCACALHTRLGERETTETSLRLHLYTCRCLAACDNSPTPASSSSGSSCRHSSTRFPVCLRVACALLVPPLPLQPGCLLLEATPTDASRSPFGRLLRSRT